MRVGVIGINHKLADLTLREKLAKAALKKFTLGILDIDHHCIVLSTCNRTEIYFSSDDLSATHSYILFLLRDEIGEEFDQKMYSFFGQDCFLHLCRVTTGLDSAILAETEIQGQVKAAYENGCKVMELPKDLHYLFQKSLKISKQVRADLPMGRGMPDIEDAIVNTGKHLFENLENTSILVVGASAINLKIISFLQNKHLRNITLCNRTIPTSNIVESILPWEKLNHWHMYEWIIFGTKAPHHLIEKEHLPKDVCGRKLIIDLSVPRNVDPCLAKDPRVTLLNIDQINRMLRIRRNKLRSSLDQAELMIFSLVCKHTDLYQQKISKVVA